MSQIYKINKQNKEYFLEPFLNQFTIPPKMYGGLDKLAFRFWRSFSMNNRSMGIMLTGESGSGKTQLAEFLGNIGLINNFDVVMINDIDVNLDLVRFIDNLNRYIIILDEFAKNFNKLQNKMLTMFNDIGNSKKMFIITDNDENSISEFIRNRPGRIRYHIDFKRIKESVIFEYALDYNVDTNSTFFKDLLKIYNKSIIFSFDHLQAIISEHIENPEDDLETLLSLLNLNVLMKETMITVIKCYNIKTKETIELAKLNSNNLSTQEDRFNKGYNIWLYPDNTPSICVSKDSIIELKDNLIICLIDKTYEVTLEVSE